MKLHKEFQSVYKKGKSAHAACAVLFFLPQNEVHSVGFTATKKIGNAVKRNRAKRRMRALFCEFSSSLQDGTYVFVAKQPLIDAPYEQLREEFRKVLRYAKALK